MQVCCKFLFTKIHRIYSPNLKFAWLQQTPEHFGPNYFCRGRRKSTRRCYLKPALKLIFSFLVCFCLCSTATHFHHFSHSRTQHTHPVEWFPALALAALHQCATKIALVAHEKSRVRAKNADDFKILLKRPQYLPSLVRAGLPCPHAD